MTQGPFWIDSTEFGWDADAFETDRNSAEQIELGTRVRSWFRQGFAFDRTSPRHVPAAVWGIVAVSEPGAKR